MTAERSTPDPGSGDPVARLSASERAELELLAEKSRAAAKPDPRARKGRPVNEDAVQIPEHGMLAALKRFAGGNLRLPSEGLLEQWKAFPETQKEVVDRLSAEADREAYLAAQKARQANRHASYLRARNPQYATRTFENLKPQQRMGGMIEGWLDSPDAPPTLVLLGLSRAGKTGAGYAIANEAHARGMWVEVVTAHGAAEALRDDKVGAWQRFINCDLLFLDDLGRERVTDWWRDFLQDLVNYRHGVGAVGKRMLVTANTDKDLDAAYQKLLKDYGDPIVERLMDYAGVLMFDGPPIRTMVTSW